MQQPHHGPEEVVEVALAAAGLQRGPHRGVGPDDPRRRRAARLGVALQVAFERQTLKPVFRLIGYRLWV
jgi:hypothetical protein